MRRIVFSLAAALIAAPTPGATESLDSQAFDGLRYADTEVGLASWSTACGDVGCCDDTGCCDIGCCDSAPCCDSIGCGGCCSDACGSACGTACCQPLCNCGLLGHGILTHDACGEGCVLPELLLGWFCRSQTEFDDFISPMTNPVLFEDPRNLTEMRGIFLHHDVPQEAGGGDIQLYALQLRARLTDRLSLIAAKDGFIVSDNPLVDDGWADVDIGFKYQFYRDVRRQRLASLGIVYDAPWGTPRALQAGGDGEFHLFATGGTQLGCHGHWVSAFGGVIPVDDDASNSMIYWSNHFDYQFRKGWYGLLEFNWFHWTGDGNDRLGLTGVSGGDLFNFGSAGVEGNDIVTGAFGMKYKPNRKTEIGVAWETPLTERRDVLQDRLTVDLILRY